MLLILFLRLVGLYLKRFSLQARKFLQPEAGKPETQSLNFTFALWALNLGAIGLSGAFAIFAILGTFQDFGLINLAESGQTLTPFIAVVGLLIPVIELGLVIDLSSSFDRREKRLLAAGDWLFSRQAEILADFCLFVYLLVWQVFSNFLISVFARNAVNVPLFIFFFIISLVVFIVFYVAPRTVFLLEDRKNKIAWLSISLVFLTSFLTNMVFIRNNVFARRSARAVINITVFNFRCRSFIRMDLT